MINLYNQVPSIYSNASRDFQYLSWLFNIVLNSVKHNVDDIYNLPSAAGDPKLTELLAMTLGFKIKRNYDQKQLTALVAILHSALRYKGTEKAILMAAEALVKAMGSLGEADVQVQGTEVIVTLPRDLVDITLFLDILDYILPAGMTCRIIRKNQKKKAIDSIQVRYSDEVKLVVANDLAWTEPPNSLSDLFDPDSSLTGDTAVNVTRNVKPNGTLNAGLLDNAIIPVLADSRAIKVDESVYTTALYSSTGLLLHDSSGKVLKARKTTQKL